MSSLLTQCASFLRDHLLLSDHVDTTGTKLYPQSFTVRELKNVLRAYTTSSRRTFTSNALIEALIASLEMQLFFYNATWKSMEQATDDDICILLRSHVNELSDSPRSKLSSLPVPSACTSVGAVISSLTEHGSVEGIRLITSSPTPQRSDVAGATCLPTGVMSSLSKCYSPTCDESHPCYSSSCPNRNRKKKFTVQCYSNGCRSGYGCYSPTCPCRYEADSEIEIDDSSTVISFEVRSPSPVFNADAMLEHSIPRSVHDLPKLSLNPTSEVSLSDTKPITSFHVPLVSPGPTFSTYSFTSSLSPSSIYAPMSPISPLSSGAWDSYSPTDTGSDADIDLTNSPVAQTLPRIYTHFPYINSYQASAASPCSSSRYALSPAGLTTPISPNWEPLLLISMVGPSITWQDRLSSSGTPTSAYESSDHVQTSHATHFPFSSILRNYLDNNDRTDTPRNTEAGLMSPMTPQSVYSP